MLSRLLNKLKEAKQPLDQFITRGNVQDFAQYKFLVGQIIGLEAAIEMCRKLLKESGEIDE